MKTNEFIKRVNSLGYEVYINVDAEIMDEDGWTISCISGTKERDLEIKALAPFSIIELAVGYAKTPLEEREKEPKYKLRHKWLKENCEDRNAYLNFHKHDKTCFLSNDLETTSVTLLGTRAEWEQRTGRTWEQLMQEFDEEEAE